MNGGTYADYLDPETAPRMVAKVTRNRFTFGGEMGVAIAYTLYPANIGFEMGDWLEVVCEVTEPRRPRGIIPWGWRWPR